MAIGPRAPPSLPRDAITLLTVLLIVFLVSFPASSAQVAVVVLLGGGVYMLLAPKSGRNTAQYQPKHLSAVRAVLLNTEGPEGHSNLADTRTSSSSQQSKGPLTTTDETDATFSGPVREQQLQNGPVGPGASGASGSPQAINCLSSSVAATQPPASPQHVRPKSITASDQPLAGGAAVLARLRQQRARGNELAAAAARREAAVKPVIVTYASQTGTAQEIAKGIQAEAASHGIKAKIMSLNELGFDKVKSGQAPVLVVVAASTGDGDPPDNAAQFYATMRRRTQELGTLQGVKFTCLGLGDSNYTRFMGVSRSIRSRLQELGAEPFYDLAEADEVDGLEATVDPWIEGLWAALKQAVGAEPNGTTTQSAVSQSGAERASPDADESGLDGVPPLPACRVALRWIGDATQSASILERESACPTEAELAARDPAGVYSPAAPFWAAVASASYLTAEASEKKVLHLSLDLGDSGIEYRPGDALGVSPLNSGEGVAAVLRSLGVDGRRVFEAVDADDPTQRLLPHLGCPCSVRRALAVGVDLTSPPRKSLLRLLAEHCTDAGEQRELLALSSRGGRAAYAELVSPACPTFPDLLARFRSCRPPLAAVLDALPPLAPRLYSVSSSPLEGRRSADVAFSVVQIGAPGRNIEIASSINDLTGAKPGSRWGVATGWLERKVAPLLAGDAGTEVVVPVHLRRGGAFGLPRDLAAPLVMIGPGTGVTPFRGFLQHRRQLLRAGDGPAGPALLYFGCRDAASYLYRDDLEGFAADGTLTRLEVCYSRTGAAETYVQHRLQAQAAELWPLLSDATTHLFVCGDGAKMAKDVHAALLAICEAEGGLPAQEAAAHLAAMTKQGRYVRDIWS